MVQVIVYPWPNADCPRCHGGGYDMRPPRRRSQTGPAPCVLCNGTGEVPIDHTATPWVETATRREIKTLVHPDERMVLDRG